MCLIHQLHYREAWCSKPGVCYSSTRGVVVCLGVILGVGRAVGGLLARRVRSTVT